MHVEVQRALLYIVTSIGTSSSVYYQHKLGQGTLFLCWFYHQCNKTNNNHFTVLRWDFRIMLLET